MAGGGRSSPLLPEDGQIIAGLRDVMDPEELSNRIRKIHNIPIRRFLEKYILSYLRHWYK